MQLELRHLRIVKAVADARSLTAAAKLLGVSQPALSAQVRRIEGIVGGTLFERGRGGSFLTPFGRFVLTRAQAAIGHVDEILQARPDDGVPRVVRVGGIGGPVMMGLIGAVAGIAPDSEISAHAEFPDRAMLDMIAGGVLACAVVADYPGHEIRPEGRVALGVVAVDPVFVALPAGHALAEADEVELADLADAPWVVSPPDGTGWPEHFFEACDNAGFTPRTRFRVNPDGALLRRLVGSGGAVSTVQSRYRASPDIAVKPLAGTPMRMRHLLAWRPDGFLSRHAADLITAARAAFEEDAVQAPVYQRWLHAHRPFHSSGAIDDWE